MLKAFRWYEKTYKVKVVDSKDPLEQIEGSKSSIKNLLRDLLDEVKGFKYHQTKWRHKLLLPFILILLIKQ